MKKRICLFFACLALAGCAQFRSIQPAPANAPKANLRVIGSDDGFVRGNSQGQSEGTILSERLGSQGLRGHRLGMPDPDRARDQPFAEFPVEAGKPFSLLFITGIDKNFFCAARGSFLPEAGKNYEAFSPLQPDDKDCTLAVFVLENGQWIPVQINKQ